MYLKSSELEVQRSAQSNRHVMTGLGNPDQDLDDMLLNLWKTLPNCGLFALIRMQFGWLPKQICTFSLGKSRTGNLIKAFYFPGKSKERALVIAGVHGSELSGIEVAKMLVRRLFEGALNPPYYHVIVVPEFFPDNAILARQQNFPPGKDSNIGRTTDRNYCPKFRSKDGELLCVDPNRQFPALGKPFDLFEKDPKDAKGRPIEPENNMLLRLITSFRPSRIASLHAHSLRRNLNRKMDAPGIFADPHPPAGGKDAQARTKRDCELALAMARCFERNYNQLTGTKSGADRIPGNWLNSKQPVCWYGSKASHQPGISLGGWGPSRGISVITVEVRHYYPGSAGGSPVSRGDQYAKETVDGKKNRLKELLTYSTVIREVFLGSPSINSKC